MAGGGGGASGAILVICIANYLSLIDKLLLLLLLLSNTRATHTHSDHPYVIADPLYCVIDCCGRFLSNSFSEKVKTLGIPILFLASPVVVVVICRN